MLPVVALCAVGGLAVAAMAALVFSHGQSHVEQFIEVVVALAGAVSSLLALLVPRLRDPRPRRSAIVVPGVSVAVPSGALPIVVRGRDELMIELRHVQRGVPAGPAVVAGMGGVGKSTVTAAFAMRWHRRSRFLPARHVWWVSAADPSSLTGGLVTVAAQLGASRAEQEVIRIGGHDAPDRLWRLLERSRHRWLLVFDNADEPSMLGRPAIPGAVGDAARVRLPADGTGWARRARKGLVVVTTRHADPAGWGRDARVLPVEPLGDDDAALVLMDCAPQAGDEASAKSLARRLGGLPLLLQTAGSDLAKHASLRPSFDDYARSLATSDPSRQARLLTSTPRIGGRTDPRSVPLRTWEISLDHLARAGLPHARPLLRLLSCFAAATPIPWEILNAQCLSPLLTASGRVGPQGLTWAQAEHRLEDALDGLAAVSLIDIRPTGGTSGDKRCIVIHPVVADVNRIHLNQPNHPDIDAQLVRQGAVELLTSFLGGSFDAAVIGDWPDAVDAPRYLVLTPHVHALLDTVAPHTGREQVRGLVAVATDVSSANSAQGLILESERLARAAIIAGSALGDDDPVILRARHALAWAVAAQGRYVDAEITGRDVFERFSRVLGDNHRDTITASNELAWMASCQRRWAEAENRYRKVLAARSQALGELDPMTLITQHELGWTIASQGHEAEAEQLLRDVLDARTRVHGERHRRTLTTRHELAWIAARLGRLGEAEISYRYLIECRRDLLGPEHPDTLTAQHELAWVLALRGKRRAARHHYRLVLGPRSRFLGPDHPDTNATRDALRSLRAGKIITPRHIA